MTDKNKIVVDGELFDIGKRVVKWTEDDGFSFYDKNRSVIEVEDRKTGKTKTEVIKGRRYSWRPGGINAINQFFIHHTGGDGDGAARVFRTLHNERGLSVHFVIDDDGTIFQFGDVRHCAWHAGKHNKQSIGVECNLYPLADKRPNYYSEKRNNRFNNQPHEIVDDIIHGRPYRVFRMTDDQLDSLAALAAGCWVGLLARQTILNAPIHSPQFPRDIRGNIPQTIHREALKHTGLIGHLQATRRKIDPAGFPWLNFENMVLEKYAQMREEIG